MSIGCIVPGYVWVVTRVKNKVWVERSAAAITHIYGFSSVAVGLHLEGESIYAASKAAVESFSRVFAREVAAFNITCNVIAPSPIWTDLISKVPKEKMDALVERIPIKRMGTMDDVWNVVAFFLRLESDGVTGQVLTLGGV